METITNLIKDTPVPKMVKVRQNFDKTCIPESDIPGIITRELDRPEIGGKIQPGQKIAITCGSRGINHNAVMARAIVDFVKSKGAEPYIVAAMGSHGGATAEGQLQIQIYPEDSLGNLDDGRWYFENGAVDMRIGAGPSDVSSIATWLPTLTGCTPDEVSQALRPGQPLWDLICQQAGDTLVLGVLPSSSRVLTSSRPVEDLSQLDGLMVRVIPSSSLDRRFWEALGAQTVEIPIQDLYLALQQGLADAQENPIYLVRSYNFHQQQKYLIPINFKVYLETIYLNLEVCRSLTEEQQALLRQAAEDTCREMVEVTARYLEECQDIFQREGMEVRPVSEEERARAREKVCPLVEEYLLSLYGADVYQQVLDALSAAPEQGS